MHDMFSMHLFCVATSAFSHPYTPYANKIANSTNISPCSTRQYAQLHYTTDHSQKFPTQNSTDMIFDPSHFRHVWTRAFPSLIFALLARTKLLLAPMFRLVPPGNMSYCITRTNILKNFPHKILLTCFLIRPIFEMFEHVHSLPPYLHPLREQNCY